MNKRDRRRNQKGTKPPAPRVEGEHRAAHRDDASQKRDTAPDYPRRHSRWTLIFNGVVALFTVVVAGATGYQGYVANQNLLLLQGQQRAWLLPYSATPVVFEAQKPLEAPVRWKNSGQTPAFGAEMTCATRTLRTNDVFLPEFGESADAASRIMVGPDQEVPQRCWTTGLTQSEVAEIKTGERRFYVYGKANYRDVFDKPRHTTFCMWLDPSGSAVACPTYNDAD